MFSFGRSTTIIKAAVGGAAKAVTFARAPAIELQHQVQRLSHSASNKDNDKEIYYKLKDQVALVTGSTKGIGFEIARRLVESGALVVISSRNEDNVKEAVKELQKATGKSAEIAGHVCHVGNKDHRSALLDFTLKHFGGIDIFVSNAAVNPAKSHILETPDEVFTKILDVNLIAPFSLSKEIVPHMVKRGGGNIIYIGSASGYMYQGAQNLSERMAAYAISKTALLGLTKAVAGKCAQLNIRVNCVAPGLIETDFAVSITGSADYPGSFLPLQTIKRIGRAEEVAGMVAFLCSQDASYISGETCTVAGGNGTRL